MRVFRQSPGYAAVGALLVAAVNPGAAHAQGAPSLFRQTQHVITHTPPEGSVCRGCRPPDGVSAPIPPAHFNPLAASDEELAFFGFPPRPDAKTMPADYAFWVKLVTLPVARVTPKLQATTVRNGPAQIRGIAEPSSGGAQGASSANWSAYAVYDANKPFVATTTFVHGTFVVPVAQQAFKACTGIWDWSFEWVGLDGWGSSDVLQAGIEADADCSSGTTQAFYSAWYEWFPNLETRISAPPVAPGDVIDVVVWNLSPTQGRYYMANETQRIASALTFNAPQGTRLQGDSVEWVVERPYYQGSLTTLTNYIATPWYAAYAVTSGANGKEYSPGRAATGTLLSITMLDNNNSPISAGYATPDGTLTYVDPGGAKHFFQGSALWFFDEGSAY